VRRFGLTDPATDAALRRELFRTNQLMEGAMNKKPAKKKAAKKTAKKKTSKKKTSKKK
jgi:hypothetical protein